MIMYLQGNAAIWSFKELCTIQNGSMVIPKEFSLLIKLNSICSLLVLTACR